MQPQTIGFYKNNRSPPDQLLLLIFMQPQTNDFIGVIDHPRAIFAANLYVIPNQLIAWEQLIICHRLLLIISMQPQTNNFYRNSWSPWMIITAANLYASLNLRIS